MLVSDQLFDGGGAMSPEHNRIKCGVIAALLLVSGLMTCGAFGQAGGRPLVLDTQTGIHSGAGGTVLQSGPLNGSGMVPARPMAVLPELPQQDQQTIVVSPYIALQPGGYSSGQGYGSQPGSQPVPLTSGSRYRTHATAPHSGSSYGVPVGAQPQIPIRPATQAAPQSSITEPVTTPIPVATPKSVPTRPTASSRSSDPHSATGSVTTSLE
jgi:hypothetical protein